MKVRITSMYFDGFRRHREGSVINISDKKYTKESEIPKTSNKKVGDVIAFSEKCMEVVDVKTPAVDVPRPIPGLTVKTKKTEVPTETPEAPTETPIYPLEKGGEVRASDSQAI